MALSAVIPLMLGKKNLMNSGSLTTEFTELMFTHSKLALCFLHMHLSLGYVTLLWALEILTL